jgi:hypothetical protein
MKKKPYAMDKTCSSTKQIILRIMYYRASSGKLVLLHIYITCIVYTYIIGILLLIAMLYYEYNIMVYNYFNIITPSFTIIAALQSGEINRSSFGVSFFMISFGDNCWFYLTLKYLGPWNKINIYRRYTSLLNTYYGVIRWIVVLVGCTWFDRRSSKKQNYFFFK